MSPMLKLPLTLEHALLGLLREQPMHAYQMYQRLEQAEALGLIWRMKQSQLYALLARLEEAGYVDGTLEPQGNRPPRRVLFLTPSGEQALDQWLQVPVAHGRDFRQEFMAKLYFAQQSGPETVARLISKQRQACEHWLATMRARSQELGETSSFDWLVLEFRIGNLEMIVNWLDTCSATLAIPAS